MPVDVEVVEDTPFFHFPVLGVIMRMITLHLEITMAIYSICVFLCLLFITHERVLNNAVAVVWVYRKNVCFNFVVGLSCNTKLWFGV